MSQKEMFTISEELMKQVREHTQSCDNPNCCLNNVLDSLEKNSLGIPTQDMNRKNPQDTNLEAYANDNRS